MEMDVGEAGYYPLLILSQTLALTNPVKLPMYSFCTICSNRPQGHN